MKILIAPDKFKGSLSAKQVCEAITKGIKKVDNSVEIIAKPLADGGDGSLEVLQHYLHLKTITIQVNDPLFRPIQASYKINKNAAYIELSAASGLILLKKEERNCMLTSSFGTGELIADALQKGVKQIFLFIGGSVTNDGGIGIANALGYQFYDKNNRLLIPIGKNLKLINKIDDSNLIFNPKTISVQVICDVNNPFYGKNGAAHVYATQKGASSEDIIKLDEGLKHLAFLFKSYGFGDVIKTPGAGAAGGVGGGTIAFLKATLVSGIQTFLKITNVENILKKCDLVITGEGKLDQQSAQGKVISGVCNLAKKHKKRVIVVCGDADLPISDNLYIDKIYTVRSRSTSLDDAMQNTTDKLEQIGMEIITI